MVRWAGALGGSPLLREMAAGREGADGGGKGPEKVMGVYISIPQHFTEGWLYLLHSSMEFFKLVI